MADQSRSDEPDTDDHVVAVLERTFASYAGQAPPAVGLPEQVHRTRRRRTAIRAAAGTGAMLAVAAAIVVPTVLSGNGPAGGDITPMATPHVDDPAIDPAQPGWRWESYGGIELQVPAEWGTGTTGSPWCLDEGAPTGPYVGRPGVVPAIGCGLVSPSEGGDQYVWFGSEEAVGTVTDSAGWVHDTRVIGGVVVTIQLADPSLAERIFATAREVEATDAFGCAAEHPLAARDEVRPANAWEAATAVASGGSACRYQILDTGTSGQSSEPSALLGSRILTADDATALLGAVAAAPTGSGPNDPANCMVDYARGDEAVVVVMATTDGPRELFVRYSGCDHHGVDDGTTVREVTPAVAAAIFDAALLPMSWSGEMDPIFTPLWEAQRDPE